MTPGSNSSWLSLEISIIKNRAWQDAGFGHWVTCSVSESEPDRRRATVIVMTIATVLVTIGDLIMSQAMRDLGPLKIPVLSQVLAGRFEGGAGDFLSRGFTEVYGLLWLIFGSLKVWFAIACMFSFLVLWMVALSWSDLTFVMPLTALTYILNAMLVGPVLGEHVSPSRWVGTLMIAFGVGLVTMEKPREET